MDRRVVARESLFISRVKGFVAEISQVAAFDREEFLERRVCDGLRCEILERDVAQSGANTQCTASQHDSDISRRQPKQRELFASFLEVDYGRQRCHPIFTDPTDLVRK